MKWYVLHVRTGMETDIKNELSRKGYGAAAPMETVLERKGDKWVPKLKKLLPGYVFVKLQLTDEDYYVVRNIPGVIQFLGVGSPEAIREDEEEYVIWLYNEDEPLGISTVQLEEGGAATVLSGPLKGHEGTILRINRRQRRATVAVSFHGYPRPISLSIDILKPGVS
jgi:transcriptional antiterminator NusG